MSKTQQRHWDVRARKYLGWVRGPYVTRAGRDQLYQNFAYLRAEHPPLTGSVKRNVLEVGAGVGELVPWLYHTDEGVQDATKRNVMLLDFSSEMVKFSRERALEAEYPVTNLRADARRIPLQDNSCDEVYTVNGFHNPSSRDQLQLFDEMHRVLRPGGMLYGLFHSWEDYELSMVRNAGNLRANRKIPFEIALEAEWDVCRTKQHVSSSKGSMQNEHAGFGVKLYSRKELEALLQHTGKDHGEDNSGFRVCAIDPIVMLPAPYDTEKDDTFEWIVAARKVAGKE